MKTKYKVVHFKSQSNIEYHLYKGLSKKGKEYAKTQVEKFELLGDKIPYGIIRKVAETL